MAETDDDPIGRELEESIKATEALLAAVRYDLGQRVMAADAGDGEMPSVFELAQAEKLETQLANKKLFAQARRMTRKRRPTDGGA